MALEIVNRNPVPEAGGYKSVNVRFSLNNGLAYFSGGVDLPGKFATLSDAEVLEEIRRQLAIQVYEGESTPALVTEYANLHTQMTILANGKTEPTAREKALTKLVNKVNKGNDKLLMTLLLNVLDAKTINDNKDVIIDAFDSYDVGVEYSTGDKFKYDGKLYEVLEDHKSVDVWKPSEEADKYKEIVLARDENSKQEKIEDENNRYVTKAQLNEVVTQMINTILQMLEGGQEDDNTEHSDGQSDDGLPHNEGGSESDETE